VNIAGVGRSGLFGVKVTGVSFLDPAEKEKVISADELRLSLRLLPLLHGEIVVTELVFVKPQILIVREKDGRLNLERYFAGKKEAEKKEEAKGPPKMALVFQNLKVEQAHILFRDEMKKLPPAEGVFSLSAKLSFSEGKLALDGEGRLDLQAAGAPVVSDLKFRLHASGETIVVTLLGGKVLEGNLTGEIKLHQEAISGLIKLEKADFKALDQLAQKLKPYFFPEAELPSIAGQFDLVAHISGSVKNPVIKATFKPHPLRVHSPPYRLEISGQGTLQDMVLQPDFDISINGEKLKLTGKIDLRPKVPRADLLISAQKFNVKPLLPEESAPPKETKVSATKKPAKGSLSVPLTGKIRIQMAELCYLLCAKDVKSEIDLKTREITLRDLSLLLAGATIQAQGRLTNLTQTPRGRFSFSLAGLDLPLLLDSLVPKSNYFASGRVWSEGNFAFQGLEADLIKKTLSGLGKAKFLDLGLKPSPITDALASLLRMDELKRLHFKNGEGSFEVKNGLVHLRGKFQHEGLGLSLQGTIGLDGRLNLTPKIFFQGKMAELFAKRFPAASLFKTQTGYVVPLTIRGTLDQPKLALVQVEKKIKEKAKEKAMEKLFQFLGPKKKD